LKFNPVQFQIHTAALHARKGIELGHDNETTPPSIQETFFAPAGRAGGEDLNHQVQEALSNPIIKVLLESVQGYLLILNEQRQILAANPELLEALNNESPDWMIGLRPGELLNCLHFSEGPDGCGTSLKCRSCGAVLAILGSRNNGVVTSGECNMSIRDGEKTATRFFRVNATPLCSGDHTLTVFSVLDVSSAKRLELLDEIFLHDLLNSLGCMEGMGKSDSQATALQYESVVRHLKEEVHYHRSLIEAEKGTLVKTEIWISAAEVLLELSDLLKNNPRTNRHAIVFEKNSDYQFYLDKVLLIRVLFNMALNAVEASSPGDTIRIVYSDGTFSVHNPGVIPDDVSLHIFEHSFSTKGHSGRGLGTYGMKVLGEQYLGGSVSFSTNRDAGTVFRIKLPVVPGPVGETTETVNATSGDVRRPLHILFVDDIEQLARLSKLFLEREGFRVTTRTNAAEALSLLQDNPKVFGMVITDMTMPGIDGLELARRIHIHSPEMPVVLCSGFGKAIPQSLLESSGIIAVVSKPLDPKEINKIVQRITNF
jgi:CheY-like chemotaxis protein